MVEILESGMLCMLVDGSRHKMERYGVPRGGCADWLSYRLSNRLAGNGDNAAVLEAMLIPPKLRFMEDTHFAVTGGECKMQLIGGGQALTILQNRTVKAISGDVLVLGAITHGCRVYIAVNGGFDKQNGMNKALSKGTAIRYGVEAKESTPEYALKRSIMQLPVPGEPIRLRVILSAHLDAFKDGEVERFTETEYTYSQRSNRMGIHFQGERLIFAEGCDGNILSEGMLPGDIQITSSGLPILMMTDCQTVGGYTKIAHIINADLPMAAQARPGDVVKFSVAAVGDAQKILRDKHSSIDEAVASCSFDEYTAVFENSVVYNVRVREICEFSD